jgi:DNA-binding NtrC family response regulator
MQLSATHDVEPPSFSRAARAALLAYNWPGNVRELRNVVELLCILREGKNVRVQDLPPAIHARTARQSSGHDTISVRIDHPLDVIVDQALDEVIASEGGNLSRAAKRLGINVRTLQRRARR